jgi:hypothetical protein
LAAPLDAVVSYGALPVIAYKGQYTVDAIDIILLKGHKAADAYR